MKVLLLNQIPEVNSKYTFSLARGLKHSGVDVVVCGIEDDDVSAYQDVPYLNIFGCYSKTGNPLKKILIYRVSWKQIFSYCVDNKIEVVHVQWYIFSPLDWRYHQKLRRKGIKVVTTIHDLLPFNKKIYDYHFHKKIYSQSDMVISQATKNEEVLIKEFKVKKERIKYVPHGHYMEYSEFASKEESINYLGLPDNKTIILFFGQIKKVKGIDVLLKAMAIVKDKYPNAYCVIAGKVWKDDFSEYQRIIDELKLENNIRADIKFIPDNEIKYYFNASDIVALPYREIYQSGVVLLAAAYEKPVVATTEGEFLNVIRDKETGLLVEAGNEKQFADAMIYYLDSPETAIIMGKKCKDDLANRLGWKEIGIKVAQVYNEVSRE